MPSTSLADVDAWSSMAEKSASFGALPNVPLNLVSVDDKKRRKRYGNLCYDMIQSIAYCLDP